jgi:hypothetical protein
MCAGIKRGGDVKDFIPYIAVAILAFVAGVLTFRQCSSPQVTHEIRTDTLTVTEWVRVTDWKVRTIKKTDTLMLFTGDDSECCERLDDCAEQLWTIANIEAEAEQDLPHGGKAVVGFSMPVYLEKPEKSFFLQITRPDTSRTRTEYLHRDRKWYDRINLSVGAGYSVGPLGFGPGVHATIGYELFNLSNVWR